MAKPRSRRLARKPAIGIKAEPLSFLVAVRRLASASGLLLVPLVYLAAVTSLQPSDHLGHPDRGWASHLGRFVYDDYDLTAFALRGLNAHLGRLPGRQDEPQCIGAQALKRRIDAGAPLAPRFFLEYPLPTLAFFGFPFTIADRVESPPHPVLDACQHDLVAYRPRSASEASLWRRFRTAIHLYQGGLTACLLALILVVRKGYASKPADRDALVLLVLPAALYFALMRFDVLPALLTAIGFRSLAGGRLSASAVALAAATLIKVYPILFAPLVVQVLSTRRDGLRWIAAYLTTLGVMLVAMIGVTDLNAAVAPFRFQLGRPAEFGWTFYGNVLPEWLAGSTAAAALLRMAATLVPLLILMMRPRAGWEGLLRRSTLVLLAFVATQVFYSPQWVLWFLPLLVPLASSDRRLFWLAVALDLTTFITFPLAYDWFNQASSPAVASAVRHAVVGLRAIVLAAIAWVLVREETQMPTAFQAPQQRTQSESNPPRR